MTKLAGYSDFKTVVTIAGTATPGTAVLPVLIAPFGGVTVKSAYVVASPAVAANGSNYTTITLLNGGAAGTATTAIGTAGGTAGITLAPAAFSLNTALDELTAGQFLMAKVVKTGTVALVDYAVTVEYVNGKAA